MPAGDLITTDYQYEYNGLLFGSGTQIQVERVSGWLSLPGVNEGDQDRTIEHGALPGIITLQKRVIAFDVHVYGVKGTDIETRLDLVKRTFQVPRTRKPRETKPFVAKRPGQVKRQAFVRCTKRDFESNAKTSSGKASGSIQLTATDPVIYALTDSQVVATIATSGTTAPTQTATNLGDHPDGVSPVIEIVGPCRNPRVQVTSQGEVYIFAIDTDIQATERLVIDMANWSVYVVTNSNSAYLRDAFASIRLDSDWWTLLPGANSIVYTRSNTALTGSPSTATIKWKDGWS